MATALSNYYVNFMDMLKATDPTGTPADIAEILDQTNDVIHDMPVVQGNKSDGNLTTVRTGLPTGVWTKLYQGVVPSKSTTQQVEDTTGKLEFRSEIATDLLELTESPEGVVANEQLPFFESMAEQAAYTLFYSDTATNPNQFLGFAPRYPTSSTANVLNVGGSGSNCTSIWLICWGPTTCFAITPKNAPGGLTHIDRGIEPVRNVGAGAAAFTAGTYYARVNTYAWNLGLCVKDWRYVVRACNINMASGATTGLFTLDTLVQMRGMLPSHRVIKGNPAFYMHKNVWTQLELLALNKPNLGLGWVDRFGTQNFEFRGIPLRQVDQLLITETAI